jgi:hypothetical protein
MIQIAGDDAFRCKACGHIVAVDINVSPREILRCPQCEKVFGRVDSVCAEVADATCTIASNMLRMTLEKMVDTDESGSGSDGAAAPSD